MLPGAVRFEQFRGVFLRLIQFSTVFLPVNDNFNRNAVIRNRCRRICQGFLLAVSIQPLTLDNGREILIADIQIHITVKVYFLSAYSHTQPHYNSQ